MHGRKKHYIDIVLTEAKMKRLVDGYTIHAMVKGQLFAISKEVVDPVTLKINALKQQIADLQARASSKKLFRAHDILSAKPKRQLTPQALENLRRCAAHARAVRAAKRSNV